MLGGLSLLLALGACGGQASPQPTGATVAVGSTLLSPSTATATLRPTFTPGPPTSTSEPTETPTPVYTPTPIYTTTPGSLLTPGAVISGSVTISGSSQAPVHIPVAKLRYAENVNPLTGLEVSDPTVLQRRPLMVRIGNDAEVRPQTGLGKADIVYEDVMDGYWVTRFSAIYWTEDPPVIGPVRSARLLSLLLAPQYDAALMHSGASDAVRWELSRSGITNLDEYYNQKAYFYDMSKDWRGRLFTSSSLARQYMQSKGLDRASRLRGFAFSKDVQATSALTTALSVTIPYPKTTSLVSWKYDATAERYMRSVLDQPHTDAADGKQLSAANVIIYYAEHQETDIVEDSKGATSIRIVATGRGPVTILRDGLALQGSWRTDGSQTPEFFDLAGAEISLKPGNSWIEIVPPGYGVEIKG